jgi:hypothetical protein
VAVVEESTTTEVMGWPTRRLSRRRLAVDDGYPGHDVGGGD